MFVDSIYIKVIIKEKSLAIISLHASRPNGIKRQVDLYMVKGKKTKRKRGPINKMYENLLSCTYDCGNISEIGMLEY
jgi:hypothetical protein